MSETKPKCDDHERRLSTIEDCLKELGKTAKDIRENDLPHIQTDLAVLRTHMFYLKWLVVAGLGLRAFFQAKEWLGW